MCEFFLISIYFYQRGLITDILETSTNTGLVRCENNSGGKNYDWSATYPSNMASVWLKASEYFFFSSPSKYSVFTHGYLFKVYPRVTVSTFSLFKQHIRIEIMARILPNESNREFDKWFVLFRYFLFHIRKDYYSWLTPVLLV